MHNRVSEQSVNVLYPSIMKIIKLTKLRKKRENEIRATVIILITLSVVV